METILESIRSYLKENGTDYALMLTGPWGCGKTYFWNEHILPRLIDNNPSHPGMPRRHAYVSLFGISDFDQVEDSILFQLHPKVVTAAKGANVVAGTISAVASVCGRSFPASAGDLKKILRTLKRPEQLVVCFDDLERAAMPVTQLLGCINNFVEHWRAKVIILCNEQEILGVESGEITEAAKDYQREKEKIVGRTLKLNAEQKQIFDRFISTAFEAQGNVPLTEAHKTKFRQIYETSKIQNLRVLRFALSLTAVALAEVNKLGSNEAALAARIIDIFFPLALEAQYGRLPLNDAVAILRDRRPTISLISSYIKPAKNEPNPREKFQERYNLGILVDPYLISPALADLLEFGFANSADFEAEFGPEDRLKRASLPVLQRFASPWELEDQEFTRILHDSLKELRSGKFNEWSVILNNVRFLEGADRVQASDIPIKDMQEAFDAGLKVLADNNSFIPPLPGADHPQQNDGEVTKACINKLNATGATVRKTETKTQFIKALEALAADDADATLLADLISAGHGEESGNHPISDFITTEDLASAFSNASNRAKRQLSIAVEARYKMDSRRINKDCNWLNELKDRLTEYSHGVSLSAFWTRTLLLCFNRSVTPRAGWDIPVRWKNF